MKSKQLYVYTDQDGIVVFKTLTDTGEEADKQFEQNLGKPPFNYVPRITCMVSFVKESEI